MFPAARPAGPCIRRERMRRLRNLARFATDPRAIFTPEATARRRTYVAAAAADPVLAAPLVAALTGPETVPGEVFEDANLARLLALS